MENLTQLDPQLAMVILCIIAVAAIHMRSDVHEILTMRRLRTMRAAATAKEKLPRISVLIELTHSADTLIPLLDALYRHTYANLEVVIVVKQSAGKYAQTKLTAYRQKNSIKLLKVIRQTKKLTKEVLIRQKITGDVVVALHENSSISASFFDRIATEFLDREVDVIKPRQYIVSEKTFIGALRAVQYNWQNVGIRISKSAAFIKGVKPGYAYRRDALLRRPTIMATAPCRPSYTTAVGLNSATTWGIGTTTAKHAVRRFFTYTHEKILMILVASIVMLVVARTLEYDAILIAGLLLASCAALYAFFIIGLKEYSAMERIAHILFAPIGIIASAVLHIAVACIYIWQSIKKRVPMPRVSR